MIKVTLMKEKIYLGTFPKTIEYITEGLTVVSIARSIPTKYRELIKHSIDDLKPSWHSRNLDKDQQVKSYGRKLSKLNPRDIIRGIKEIPPNSKGIVLVAWETRDRNSHPVLFARWIKKFTGVSIKNWKKPQLDIDPKTFLVDR